MKTWIKVVGLIGLFLVSFVVFAFMTFPYEVLKESLAAELSQNTGYTIRIGKLSSNFPLGLHAENVRIDSPHSATPLTFKSLDADLSLLSIFTGKVGADVLVASGSGEIELGAGLGILDLISGITVPKRIIFTAKDFPLDQIFSFGIAVAANAPDANPMVAPLLSAIGVTGNLNGKMDFKLDGKNPQTSTGSAEISLAKAQLKLSHPSLGLPDQDLNKALIKATVANGRMEIDKSSGFVSDELELLTEGNVVLRPDLLASMMDMKIVFRLNKTMKEKFGFIIDAVTGNSSNEGQLTMQVRGPVGQPAVTTF
jgi:type II secretion system protein N